MQERSLVIEDRKGLFNKWESSKNDKNLLLLIKGILQNTELLNSLRTPQDEIDVVFNPRQVLNLPAIEAYTGTPWNSNTYPHQTLDTYSRQIFENP